MFLSERKLMFTDGIVTCTIVVLFVESSSIEPAIELLNLLFAGCVYGFLQVFLLVSFMVFSNPSL